MRYSEMAGKEVVDISEGMRLGVISGTDLIIDTVTGALQAMVIFQRTGLFTTNEITVPWEGIKKIGKDLIIVDMSAAVEPIAQDGTQTSLDELQRLQPRRRRHLVPGVDPLPDLEDTDLEEDSELLESEAPQLALSRMAQAAAASAGKRDGRSLWRGRSSSA